MRPWEVAQLKYSTDTQVAEKSRLELDRFIQNPLVREIKAILDQIKSFKERAKAFYFEVLLSSVRCPACNGRLNMIDQSECACSCGNVLDPTVEFQKSTCCGAKLIRKTFHYSCSRCKKVVPSRFLFDEKLFDGEYFRAMMQESRRRSQRKKEEIRRLLAESRSGALPLLEEPDLESIPGLLDDLDGFINDGSNEMADFYFDLEQPFEMDKYREHILSAMSWDSIQFSDIDPFIDDYRKDRVWRFVTLVFMQHDREVDIDQRGDELFIQRHHNEAHA